MTTTAPALKASVLSILRRHVGRGQAIKGQEIAEQLELSYRMVRRCIAELEKEHPIASTTEPPYGFYIVETAEEAREYRRVLRSRGKEIFIRYARFKQSAGRLLDKVSQGRLL